MDEANPQPSVSKKKGPLTGPLQIGYGDGVKSSFRGPVNLRDTIDKFLKQVLNETGIHFSRNTFILNAIRWYLRQLLDSKDKEILLSKLKQRFEIVDNSEDGV